jgi:hypothetical protein
MTKLRNLFVFTGIIKLMFAYLDPGTGSLIIQLLIGGVVGILVIFRTSFTSLLYFFGLRKRTETDDDSIADVDDANTDTDE